MDYPFTRPRHDISNWWFLPDSLKSGNGSVGSIKGYDSALVGYLDRISNQDKFKYIVIIIIMILFISRLNMGPNLWIGLLVGLFFVYYLNENKEQDINDESDQLLNILDGPVLKKTKYFMMDTRLIKWADQVAELKQYNVLEFNQMIKTIDRILRLIYHLEVGIKYCKQTLDIIRDLKKEALNCFQTMVFSIPTSGLREKFNYQLEELSYLLNDHVDRVARVCRLYYMEKPIDIDSDMMVVRLKDPKPDDPTYNPRFDFYN